MNENTIPRSQTGSLISLFFITFLFVFMLVCGASIIITSTIPKAYASTARLKVEYKETDSRQANAEKETYDPVLAKTEAEVINSELIMKKVIDELNLNVTWGEKYFNHKTLTTLETLALLKHRIDIHPIPDTTLIQVRVFDEKPEDAAEVANTIVNVYANYVATNANEPQVQIIDSAYPNDLPVRPNTTLDIFLGAVAGIFFGSVAGAGFALVLFLKNRNLSKASAPDPPQTNAPNPSS
jgi:capsular polysaccharide biosynthesis protein